MPAPKFNALTDAKVRGKLSPGRHIDGRGLALLVSATGGRSWQLRYKLDGTEGTYTIGKYPDVSLAKARTAADAARTLIAEGVHPKAAREQARSAQTAAAQNTLEQVMRHWLKRRGLAAGTLRTYEGVMRQIVPALGGRAVTTLEAKDIRALLDGIAAHATRQHALRMITSSLDDAVERGLLDVNPLRLRRLTLPRRPKVKNHPALLDPAKVGEYLLALDSHPGGAVGTALRLLPLVPVRPGELVAAQWDQIDLDAGSWEVYAFKTDSTRTLPLSRQAVTILRAWKAEQTADEAMVFPGRGAATIARSALRAATVTTLGQAIGTVTSHGWRSTFRSLAEERLRARPAVLESLLGHVIPNAVERAYSRAEFADEKREVMQTWGDYLDGLREEARKRAA